MVTKRDFQLEKNINQVTNQISINPQLYPKSSIYKNLRKAIIDKNNYLVYQTKNNTIEIINFRGTKQIPKY